MITVKVTRASHEIVVEAAKLRGLSIGDYYSDAATRTAIAEIEAEEARLRAIREAAVRPTIDPEV